MLVSPASPTFACAPFLGRAQRLLPQFSLSTEQSKPSVLCTELCRPGSGALWQAPTFNALFAAVQRASGSLAQAQQRASFNQRLESRSRQLQHAKDNKHPSLKVAVQGWCGGRAAAQRGRPVPGTRVLAGGGPAHAGVHHGR